MTDIRRRDALLGIAAFELVLQDDEAFANVGQRSALFAQPDF